MLSDSDVQQVVNYYKTDSPERSATVLRRKLPPPATDSSIRAAALRRIPTEFSTLISTNRELISAVKTVLNPVLSFYGRTEVYDLVVIDSPVPLMMSDSGVVLLVSTGMMRRASNDDELLGYVAHEVAHEYFSHYSDYEKHLLYLITTGGNEPALTLHTRIALMVIELQCDAFASLSLAYLKYNPLEFIKGIERIAHDYPLSPIGDHPPILQRRLIVSEILPADFLTTTPRQSPAFLRLKRMLDP